MRLQERRFHVHDGPVRMPCRVCLSTIRLDPDRVRYDDGYWIMRCPECSGTFPVRADDAAYERA